MTIRRHFAITLACSFVMLSSIAVAQDAEVERKALFRDGSAAADAGQWSVAADKFRRVVEIRAAPKALIALAIAEEHLGHLASAKHDYERASADAHAAKLAEDEATATQALAALGPRVPTVAVHVPNPDHVQSVTLDGKTIPTRDADYSVDPGKHTVVGHGDSEFREVVDVKEGEHADVSVDIAPASTSHATRKAQPVEQSASGGVNIGAITLGIVGLVGMGVASGLWVVGQGQDNDVKAQCGGQTTNCPLSLKPEADSARTAIFAGDVVFVTGVVLAATGATWFVVSTLNHGRAAVTAWVTPTGFGVRGSF